MKKLLAYNSFLLVSLLVFYNLAGFDEIEFLSLCALLFVFQASHFFVLPAVVRFGIAFWLLMLGTFLLIFLRAFNPNALGFWFMWAGVLGVETITSLAIARLHFLPTLDLETLSENKADNLQKAREALATGNYRLFFVLTEHYVPAQYKISWAELRQKFIQSKTSIHFNQECATLLGILEKENT